MNGSGGKPTDDHDDDCCGCDACMADELLVGLQDRGCLDAERALAVLSLAAAMTAVSIERQGGPPAEYGLGMLSKMFIDACSALSENPDDASGADASAKGEEDKTIFGHEPASALIQ